MRIQSLTTSENIYNYYQRSQNQNVPFSTGIHALNRDLPQELEDQVKRTVAPKEQILADYRDWKSHQPHRVLPKSKGPTEENLSYLKLHFSGTLSLFERVDALDTMCEMGILSEDQMLNYLGLGESTISVITKDTPNVMFIPSEASAELVDWMRFFGTSSVGFCDDLEKLLNVIDVRMRFEGQENVAEQIQAVLNKIAYKVRK